MVDIDKVFTVDLNYNKHAPVDVRVEDLSYTVSDRPVKIWQRLAALQMPWEWLEEPQTKLVLRNISFAVKNGKMLAIMGSSGSGKTSLLDVIACRTMTGEVTGEVYLNGVARTRTMLDACSAYVRQDDRLLGNLTVRETLMFVAQLKLPTNMKQIEMEDRVKNVMSELGLSHVADTRVGNSEIRGVSGGERRRISIGIQLLVDPSILFLDEPTSGLDSFTAHHLVNTLSNLAKNDRTVLLSIHQPRSDIFELFDMVLLLSRGQVVYFGEAKKMVDYFTDLGFPCPELTNPCDHYMDLATVDTTTDNTENRTSDISDSLVAAYARHAASASLEDISADSNTKKSGFDPIDAAFKTNNYNPGQLKQFSVLFNRSMRNIVEDYALLLIQFLQALSMSLILGFVFFELKRDQLSLRDHFGLLYMISVMYPYMIVLDVIGQCHKERRYLYFELQDKLYSVGAYYFAKLLSELPFHTFYVTVYTIPMYFLADLEQDPWIFLKVFAIVFISVYCSRSLAMFSASLMPTFQISGFFAQSFFSIFIMSAGFFINLDNILFWLRWVADVSYLRWGFEGLCLVVVSPLNFTCDGIPEAFCVQTGEEAMSMYAFRDEQVWEAVVGIGGSIFVFLSLYFVGLKYIPQKPHEA
ncbi:ATP-binding cassette sub-family G member 8-like [Haliotis asinina]|uniref:ATP-binding cassette sub-family G member 8-like n=1 Tax=Haliotis asinina TaxID=109174 RepID=UPI003531BEEF